jgi:multiple sugar transport system substrate-binding protein
MKKIIFSALLVLAATTLFATGKTDSPSSGALTGEIRFSWWGTPARDNATIEAIRLYESLHPGVKIVPEPGVFDGYQQKLMAQLAAGNAPDVFTMNPEWLPQVVELGALADLTGKVDVSSHNPEIAKACSVDGKMYGVNASVNANVIVYNKTQADELGIKMPTGAYTWDDLVKICQEAYQKSGGKTYGIPDFRGRNALENFVPNFAFTQLGKEPPFPWTDKQIIMTGADVAAVFDYWDKVPAGVLLPADESSLLGSNDDPICTRRTFV